jgi:hypothetical protein
MPYDSAGNFSRIAGDYVFGTVISETAVNTEMADIATGLSTAITKTGKTTPTANLPMGGYRHTGVGDGAARNDYAALGQVQNQGGVYVGTVGGTADAITLTPSPAIAAYAAGQRFVFIAGGNNTGAVTVNVSGKGVKDLTKDGVTALAAGDILSGALVTMQYDGTQFQLLSVLGAVKTGNNIAFTGDNSFAGTSLFTGVPTIRSTDAGAAEGPALNLDRNSASPADNDLLAALSWLMRSDTPTQRTAAKLLAQALDVSDGSEDAILLVQTILAGTLATRGYFGAGLVVGAPTGGDKGAGTVNATALYVDGTNVTASQPEQTISSTTLSGGGTNDFPFTAASWRSVTLKVTGIDITAGGTISMNLTRNNFTGIVDGANTYRGFRNSGASNSSTPTTTAIDTTTALLHDGTITADVNAVTGWIEITVENPNTTSWISAHWRYVLYVGTNIVGYGHGGVMVRDDGEGAAVNGIRLTISGGGNIDGAKAKLTGMTE